MKYALIDYATIYVTKWDQLAEQFLTHLSMTTAAVLLALLVGVPLGILITRSRPLSTAVISAANVMQSIPCMALLALGIPFLGIGDRLAVFMVFVYALLPMSIPYIMSGIRIAAVAAVSTMTIAAFAGASGLGTFIQLDMNSRNYPMTLMGAVASSVMALLLDFLLGRVEHAFTSEGLMPQEQIRNLSAAVRRRQVVIAAALCTVLLAVTVWTYVTII